MTTPNPLPYAAADLVVTTFRGEPSKEPGARRFEINEPGAVVIMYGGRATIAYHAEITAAEVKAFDMDPKSPRPEVVLDGTWTLDIAAYLARERAFRAFVEHREAYPLGSDGKV